MLAGFAVGFAAAAWANEPSTAPEANDQPPALWNSLEDVAKLDPPIQFENIFKDSPGLTQPVWFSAYPVGQDSFIALEHRAARIWLYQHSERRSLKTLFADLSSEVSDGPWEGLVCIAFHPDYKNNHRYFLKHETFVDDQRVTQVVERRANETLRMDSGQKSRVLLQVEQPADNHNGGTIAFGPDGYLYIAMGDGGPQKDPNGLSQSGQSFQGKILRIDVDPHSNDQPYGIPNDNPFVNDPKVRDEIFARGLREPWRFSFDSVTGDLWVGDVGQNLFEEITLVRSGENHGWNVLEAFEPFSDEFLKPGTQFTPPIVAYGRQIGASVTGGYVYRGAHAPKFHGMYIFGDYATRHVFGIRVDSDRTLTNALYLGPAPEPIASFGLDHEGELLIVGYEGEIYRLLLPSESATE